MSTVDYSKRPKVTTASRRSQASHVKPEYKAHEPPVKKLYLAAARPCAICQLPGKCQVPAFEIQVPMHCMRHLMGAYRTWACPYNVNSWCVYQAKSHACYAEDLAPDSPNKEQVWRHRDLEIKLYEALDRSGKKAPTRVGTLAGLLAKSKRDLLLSTKAQNLRVCAFYLLYKDKDRAAVINKTDPEIVRLLARGELKLKGSRDVLRV